MFRGQIFRRSIQIVDEKYKAIKADISREARPTMSQDQRRVKVRAMTKVCLEDSYLPSFPIDISFGPFR